ncbi:MAG TPA: ABC transporter permease [Terriglobales bacterium]|nr:ABC transporter permease [Terriglobales bacterium]
MGTKELLWTYKRLRHKPVNILDIVRQTLSTFRAHKMRSFLTMFGIVWGIASVIILVGLGIGFNRDQRERWKALGTDLVVVWGGRTSAQAGGLAAGREIRLTIDDARLIKSECYLIKHVSPELRRSLPEVSEFNSANRSVVGIWPEYQSFRSIEAAEGRILSAQDEVYMNRVAVLGYSTRKQLFPGQPAVGATLSIRGMPYTVIGVMPKKKQNSDYSGRDDEQIFIPYSAMARDFPPPEKAGVVRGYLDNIVLQVANPQEHVEAIAQVRRVLSRVHHFEPDDKDALFIFDTVEISTMIFRIFDVMTIFFGAVAVTTLCLGGIGVMNIMLVAVTERTSEIGVRKALGARDRDIMRQFLAESASLTTISGLIGFAVGAGVCALLNSLPMPEFFPHPVVSPTSIVASILTLGVVTIGAGMYPARRAADLTPVDSLRYE